MDIIDEHARESHPRECCGILLAKSDDLSTIDLALLAKNIEKNRPEREYMLDHKTCLHAVDMEIEGTAQIVGCYHSHPQGKPNPSPCDLERSVKELVYLIISTKDGKAEYAAWQLKKDNFVQVPLEIK